MADKVNNLQDMFLNTLRRTKTPVTMFLVNGVMLQGAIPPALLPQLPTAANAAANTMSTRTTRRAAARSLVRPPWRGKTAGLLICGSPGI